jgi:hypothetical protein
MAITKSAESLAAAATACGVPTSLTVINNKNNTFTVSCMIGTNGTGNTADGAELFITLDGTSPSDSNYAYKATVTGTVGTVASATLSLAKLSAKTIARSFGDGCVGTIKCVARTTGSAGSDYYSALSATQSTVFTWYGTNAAPEIITPKATGETAGLLSGYKVSWNAAAFGINNTFVKYSVRVYDVTVKADVSTYTSSTTYLTVPASALLADHVYRFYVKAVGAVSGFDSPEAQSGLLTVKRIEKFPAVIATANAGNTVAAIEFFTDHDVYADIGTGTVVKLTWDTPVVENNEVDYYSMTINVYNPANASYSTIFNGRIGNVNEYYLTSEHLSRVKHANYKMNIHLTARSKFGGAYDSPTANSTVYVSKSCGTYIEVSEGFKEPIMKRTIAFAQLGYRVLTDASGKALIADDGNPLYGKIVNAQNNNTGWTPMQEFYTKTVDDFWVTSDIRYEVLTDSNGEIITDSSNEAIYTL